MKKIVLLTFVGVIMALAFSGKSFAGEVDILVDKLVEKGILTPVETQIILDETKQEVAKEVAQGKSYALPSWVQKMKFKGDLRTRYQWQEQDTTTGTDGIDRNRARVRFRLGMKADVTDKVVVGAGLATGGTDPRSTNETLDNTFETPDIRLDYAYAQYTPYSWATLTGGKIKNPLWRPSDLLWDSDINPDGVAISLKGSAYPSVDLFLNSGLFILDESSGEQADPIMWVVQPGFKWQITDMVALKGSFDYYGFNGLKGKALAHRSDADTNTIATDPRGGYLYDYNSYGTSAELGFKKPFGSDGIFEYVPYLAGFGGYHHNPDSGDEDDAWVIGSKIGYEKVKKQKQWQVKYMYKRLERDSWLDVFPDSDFYGGATDVKGHEVILEYGLLDNVILGLDYYNTQRLSGDARKENLFQADIVFKF